LTKYVVITHFGLGESISVISGLFALRYVRNTGAAWGLFADSNPWLVLFSCAILIGIIIARRSIMSRPLPYRIAMALVVAGVIGNLFDRLHFGFVVDFFDFYWKDHHFPTFNIADCSICIGVGVYLIASYFLAPSSPEESSATDSKAT
jgi:signal peptidase II